MVARRRKRSHLREGISILNLPARIILVLFLGLLVSLAGTMATCHGPDRPVKAIKAPPGDPVASVGPFERLDEESLRVIAALDKLKTLRTGPRGYLKFEDAHARVWLWPDGDGYEIETR